MNIQNIRHIGIFTDSDNVTAWLSCSLKLTTLLVDTVSIIKKADQAVYLAKQIEGTSFVIV